MTVLLNNAYNDIRFNIIQNENFRLIFIKESIDYLYVFVSNNYNDVYDIFTKIKNNLENINNFDFNELQNWFRNINLT